MKQSAHRYRQSRQGATLTSSRWFKPMFGLCLFAGAVVVMLLLTSLLHHASP